MEDQVASAIEIAGNPSSDQALKTQAFEYVNQLRTNPAGWQVCFAIFTKSPRASDLVRHVALEIVSSATQSGLANTEGLNFIKDNLMEYLRQIYGPNSANAPDPVNIQNKIAQTITFLFCALYSDVWTSFFDDMLNLAYPSPQTIPEGNPLGIIFYLRVLNSVHEEIGDVLVSRPPAEQEKANMLKDLIRHRDVQKLVNSWQEILAQWQSQNDLISQICLKAIGNYVSWIDISLVVNQSMLDLLFQQLAKVKDPTLSGESEKARDVAIDVFTEIVGKKMKPSDKINMIVFLDLESIVSHLTASPLLQDYRFTSKYDTDLAETLSKLVNITTIDIVKILNNDTIDNETRQKAETLLQAFLRHILRYFSDEYDEVCSTIIPSMSDLLAYFRKMAQRNPEITSQQAHMLLPILKAIVQKMRYDDSSSWGNEEEVVDEAEFQELRKRLGNLQQMVAATNQPLYIDAITEIVQTTLERVRQPGTTVDWRDLNLALHEMYLLGELAVRGNSLYTKSKPNNLAAERLIEMINVMVESDITTFAHPATQLQSMEICVRYSSFFEHHPHLISNVLANFLQLVHHPMIKVKTRSWYLFYRFVKHLRNRMENVAETVISALGDLLPIHAEIEQEGDGADDMSSEDREGSADAIFTQQLYLFEAIGCICSISSIPPASQALYVRSAMTPLFMEMESNLSAAKSNDERAILQIHHDIMALGTLAKGFADVNLGSSIEGSPPEVSEVFGQAAEANLVALEALNFSINIRTAARFAFSRLIGIQGSQILPQFPKWIDGLLTPNTTKDELALFLRLQDQVIFGFKTEMYGILDTLLTPFLQHVFAGFTDPVKGTDDEIQLAELKREYLNFLNIILSNDLGAVIISSANQPIFESLIGTVERFATDVEDLPTAKMAFSVLSRMSSLWGGADVAPAPNHPTPVTPQPDALPGFAQFMITRFSPLCWALPMTASFNSKDAQAKQALGEAAVLQKTIYMKTGAEYSEWLRHTELPGIGMGEPLIDEYLGTLERLDVKAFRQFFQSFIQRLSA